MNLDVKFSETSCPLCVELDAETKVIGETDHRFLKARDSPDQHPIEAITGLREELDRYGTATDEMIDEAIENYGKEAEETTEE